MEENLENGEKILEELKAIRKILDTLTEEHILHFNEWRFHNMQKQINIE